MTHPVLFEKVAIGDELPPLEIAITRTLIVAGAIASRDYQNVHHDIACAQAQGMSDIFMNILTTNGLVGRYLTDWAGPNCTLRNIAIKLGAPNFPGDSMHLTGSVSSSTPECEGGVVEVHIRGANSLGIHVTGVASIKLPGEIHS